MVIDINLGDKVRCKVTGFEGVVTSRTEFLNMCVRYGVQPPVDKDGKLQDAILFDEQQLEVLARNVVTGRPLEYAGNGADPGPAPSEQSWAHA
jgi:hypothetical protein